MDRRFTQAPSREPQTVERIKKPGPIPTIKGNSMLRRLRDADLRDQVRLDPVPNTSSFRAPRPAPRKRRASFSRKSKERYVELDDAQLSNRAVREVYAGGVPVLAETMSKGASRARL